MGLSDEEAAALAVPVEVQEEQAGAEEVTEEAGPDLPPSILDHACEDSNGLIGWVWCESHGGRWNLRVPTNPGRASFAFVLIAFCPFCGEKLPPAFSPGGECPAA